MPDYRIKLLVLVLLSSSCLPSRPRERTQYNPSGSVKGKTIAKLTPENTGATEQNLDTNKSVDSDLKPVAKKSAETGPINGQPMDKSSCLDTICKIEESILKLTNQVRAKRSLPPLKANQNLAYVARDWSRQQNQLGYIGHQGFPNARLQVYSSKFGGTVSLNCENVAAFTSFETDPNAIGAQFVRMWINSPGHYRNIMSSAKSLGVGVVAVNKQYFATQIMAND